MANLLKLKADEKNNLKFEVGIQGATEPVSEIQSQEGPTHDAGARRHRGRPP